MLYNANKAAAASVRGNNISNALLDRKISGLIFKLDMVADRIPPDDLSGTNEAIESINEVVEFLNDLRRQ
jgi:hypothetical protein